MDEFGKSKLFELIKINSADTLYRELQLVFNWLK
jgi:hypothetical protein